MPLYVVNVLTTFREKFVLEANSKEDASDEIVMTEHNREYSELTQRWLGDQIVDIQEMTMDELEKHVEELREDDRELCSHWMPLESIIHKVSYGTSYENSGSE